MRGAGTTYNDFLDRDIDAKVERTRNRPLASGRVSPRAAAMLSRRADACRARGSSLLQSVSRSLLAPASLAIVAIYPLMKRITFWPQAVLGLAFAFGALVGWAAEMGSLAWPAVSLYLGGICWTIGYDTIYALQDIEDDLIAGVKSTALRFGTPRARGRRRVLCPRLRLHWRRRSLPPARHTASRCSAGSASARISSGKLRGSIRLTGVSR